MAYTTADTPALVHRIDSDLDEVVATVREADPHLRSLVLTGGFARGEGTVLAGEPQNDYDLVAVRGLGRPREPYARLRTRLETLLGLHVDLAPVPAWRLRRAPRSIFWYETALRGRVLWGEDLLPRIPVRDAADLDPREGLRLLANRAAGLLLATRTKDGDEVRIQAAKALLAAFDVHLLAAGRFAPSQAERWRQFQDLVANGEAPPALEMSAPLLAWAFRFKTEPNFVAGRDPEDLWRAARRVLLQAVPVALRHAGLGSLQAAQRGDGLLDRATYALRSRTVPGARRLVLDPTARVRVATLRLLEATPDGRVRLAEAERCLAGIAKPGDDPLRTLEGLRRATRQ
jgi:hypothetical protein